VKDQIEATAGLAQLSIESPIRNELPMYASPPFNTKVCEALSKVSPTFNDMAMSGELSVQMIDILANISSLVKDGTISSPINGQRTSPESRGSFLHSIADLRCLSVLGVTLVERFLCHGLIACCYTLHFQDGRNGKDYLDSLQDLEDMLTSVEKRAMRKTLIDKSYKDCLVWISIAAAGALAMFEYSPTVFVILDHAFVQYPNEMARWENLSKILKKFLWSHDLLTTWNNVWQKAMIRRSRPW
jgi:hypothetical protein